MRLWAEFKGEIFVYPGVRWVWMRLVGQELLDDRIRGASDCLVDLGRCGAKDCAAEEVTSANVVPGLSVGWAVALKSGITARQFRGCLLGWHFGFDHAVRV